MIPSLSNNIFPETHWSNQPQGFFKLLLLRIFCVLKAISAKRKALLSILTVFLVILNFNFWSYQYIRVHKECRLFFLLCVACFVPHGIVCVVLYWSLTPFLRTWNQRNIHRWIQVSDLPRPPLLKMDHDSSLQLT